MCMYPLRSEVFIQAKVVGRSVGGKQTYDVELANGQLLLRDLPASVVFSRAEVAPIEEVANG